MTWFRQEKPGGNNDGKSRESDRGVWLVDLVTLISSKSFLIKSHGFLIPVDRLRIICSF